VNFAALKQELADRGFSYLSDTRRGIFINQARQRLDNHALWPYRLTTNTGTGNRTIADLSVVKRVRNSTLNYEIVPRSEESLLDEFGDLALTGSPAFFYVDTSAGSNVVTLYPSNASDTIQVRYYKRTTDLVNSTDTPLAPADYHYLIVEWAAVLAYRDSDNFAEAQQQRAAVDDMLAEMRSDLLGGMQVAGPAEFQALSGNSFDG
jgi:hypothetical protein